jgi:mono/diheme cytochrome c family protein
MPVPRPLDPPEFERSLDRHYIVGLCCMALLIVAFPLYRLGEPQRRAAARDAAELESVALGREAFGRHCAACHGADAQGGSMAPTLAAQEFLSATSDQQLYWLIAGGVPGSLMSAYHLDLGGPFTPQEIDRLVRYLRSLEASAVPIPNWRNGARRRRDEDHRSHDEPRDDGRNDERSPDTTKR